MAYPQENYYLDSSQKQSQYRSVNSKSGVVYYQDIVELGYAYGVGKYGMNNFRFNFTNGLRINPNLFFGLSTGFRYYSEIHESYSYINSRMLIPVFLNIQTNLSSSPVSPYLAIGIGGTFSLEGFLKRTRYNPGLFESVGALFNSSAGVSIKLSERCYIITGITFEIQKMKFLIYPNPETKERDNSLSLNCGVSF
jgi:hypothetical protein